DGVATECASHVHDQDRWHRHPVHSGEVSQSECSADYHHTWLASSIIELVGVIDPLTNPAAHGGRAEDAFDVVIPSMPGYGFSGKPTGTGWDPDHIARAWGELMKRLGYARYVAQGGDWGSPITEAMARQMPAGLVGIHVNLPATIPPEIGAALGSGSPAPAG